MRMQELFQTSERRRGAYLSRLFAFFSEEVVRHWAACEGAPYKDLGRPTVWDSFGKRHTLDFTLERRRDKKRFVAELKCEIEFNSYRYLNMTGPDVVSHHETLAAFEKFLRLARQPEALKVTVGGKEQEIAGSILGWGAVTPAGRVATMEHYGLADVLSLEEMLADLEDWQPAAWRDWVQTRRRWSDELFDWLVPQTPG